MPSIQFKGKSVIETFHHTVPHHRLEFDAGLSVLGKGEKPSLDGNLIIEGDNLLALKALLPTHAGKVKCIYIDPPYNTGNEGWIYNDNLTQPQFKEWIGQTVGKEGEDATRHDKWCCMMYPRLRLLWELLQEDGLIWVSIDDIEVASLRLLMDDVFGPESFLGQVVWNTRNTDNRVGSMLSVDHEYILVYSKGGKGSLRGRVIDRSDFANPDDDPRGPYVTAPLTGLATASERPNLHFEIRNPKTGHVYKPPPGKGWITSREGIERLIAEDRVWWPPNSGTGKPRKKRYLSETSERMPVSTWWSHLKGASGADEVETMLGKRLFAFPKPLDLLRTIVDLSTADTDIILDCTAGSGTTAHAVLAANKADGSKRVFVLVQQPFDTKADETDNVNICRTVTRERVSHAITGRMLKAERSTSVRIGLGGSFTYARVGEPLFSEYKDFGKRLPSFTDLAKYIFYTETSRDLDMGAVNERTGFIGRTELEAFYLLYTPNHKEDRELSTATLESLASVEKKSKRLVVYCEKVWMHPDELRRFERERGVQVRPMLVPFNLR